MQSETSKKYINHLLSAVLSDLNLTPHLDSLIISNPEEKFGDYATNAALVLAKQAGKNPKELAESIISKLKELDVSQVFVNILTVGGFINFRLSKKAFLDNLNSILEQKEEYGSSQVGKGKKVVFEYSSPNTNKPLHIGHTRNDVYGVACINLLKAQGYQVVSCEIINDRGIHVMKSLLMYLKFGNGKTPKTEKIKPDHFVGKYYQMFAIEAGKSEFAEKQLLEEAQALLQKWEAGDIEVKKTWQQMNDWFYEGVKETYTKEGAFFDEVDFESQFYDKGRELVLEGLKQGVFAKEEDGSVFVDLTEQGLDKKYLLRKDGTTLYITQDIYLWHLRDEKHHPEFAIVTTSAEQVYHFKVLAKIFELLNFPFAKNFKHLPYEHVFLGNGKMSSRGGNTISADDLVESVKQRIREIMKNSEKAKTLSDNENLVEAVAFGAIKYGYLKYEPNTRIYFDLEQTISTEGNTGPYIQYVYARICSILKNTGLPGELTEVGQLQESEEMLMRKLLHFGESIEQSAKEFKPNLLCNYLYELAQKFNVFYHEVPVLKEQNEQLKLFRINLITATSQVIKNGLGLLGIEVPEEM